MYLYTLHFFARGEGPRTGSLRTCADLTTRFHAAEVGLLLDQMSAFAFKNYAIDALYSTCTVLQVQASIPWYACPSPRTPARQCLRRALGSPRPLHPTGTQCSASSLPSRFTLWSDMKCTR